MQKTAPHRVHQWSKVNWDDVKGETRAFADQFCSEARDTYVDEQWESIEQHLNSVLKKHVPSKFSKVRKDQPWLNNALKRRCRHKQRMYNHWKRLKASNKSCKAARESYKKFHQDTNTLLNKARNQYLNNVLSEGLENHSHKPFWPYVKSQRSESAGVPPQTPSGLTAWQRQWQALPLLEGNHLSDHTRVEQLGRYCCPGRLLYNL